MLHSITQTPWEANSDIQCLRETLETPSKHNNKSTDSLFDFLLINSKENEYEFLLKEVGSFAVGHCRGVKTVRAKKTRTGFVNDTRRAAPASSSSGRASPAS